MNIYRHKFYSVHPNKGAIMVYELEIATTDVIQVEHLVTACALEKSAFHEDIADRLAERFGGKQTLRAHHNGVDIESRRNGSATPKGFRSVGYISNVHARMLSTGVALLTHIDPASGENTVELFVKGLK
ncbi:hypothetical protein [Cupriavidus sp. UYPR2.512]|uniref:hypothetical protein n=1 Tax=Cupriavidus sp. UYPR2.512 TaxID=1080187 RepID=UPI00037D137C|nr:hypothetical protein [Cupriavidus sp. UYPR2.512]UIF88182.1 hypothetical protein KAF44_20220 [Cupriavidus necator]